jgi:hypothetical protein
MTVKFRDNIPDQFQQKSGERVIPCSLEAATAFFVFFIFLTVPQDMTE